jgi:Tol biopolymer transport system component
MKVGVRLVALVGGIVAVAGLPAVAQAVVAGPNGEVAFVSGRNGGDASSDVYILDEPNATPEPLTTAAGQHRHPAWSPDRSKIVYALWNGADQDLWIHDINTNSRVRLTLSANIDEDRPSWSPDGTKIAYETELSDGSGQEDILIAPAEALGGDDALNLTSSPAVIENRPVWSPDGSTIYYSYLSTAAGEDADIYREPSDNSDLLVGPENVVLDTTNNEFQPALSPDGARMCFTRGATGAFVTNDTADVYTVNSSGAGAITNLSDNAMTGDYNCTWSPDGTKVAYVRGIFNTGALMYKNSDDTGPAELLADDSAGNFDGNPDWAMNPAPSCTDASGNVLANAQVTVLLPCTDIDLETLTLEIVTPPANGALGAIDQTAGEVVYTPNPGFVGEDTFTFRADDANSKSVPATATIDVRAFCSGRRATLAGTNGSDTLRGTPGSDIIAAFGGKDKVKGRGGNDFICGGGGKDNLNGAAGKDRLFGDAGKDKLKGGGAKDRCTGGGGRDTADCEVERSI